ncbi:hypothetical protein FRC04_007591 [Tulasnella sp. 424]|nr:hypothetical protein FRC04_007591 [Tulasnella sp. 424]KAG8979024.1 hypothetical protein FRC05_009234 [Tulasnella sp. 425]
MYGTNVPKPQTGQFGVHYPLNSANRNEGIEDGGFYANQVSFTGLPVTDPPLLIGNVGGVGASGGPTTDPTLPPNTGWNPNPHAQYPIPNIHNLHRAPPNGGEFIAPALLPLADHIPYSQQPSPRLPHTSSNYLHTPSFQTLNDTSFSFDSTGLARQPQDGPPLRVEDWDVFQNTGLVPRQVNIMGERIICSPETTIHAGSVISPRSETRPGAENRQLALHGFVPPNPGDKVAVSFTRLYPATTLRIASTSQRVLSPTSTHTDSQSTLNENGVAGTPYYNQFNRDQTASELGSIDHTNVPSGHSPEMTNHDRRGSSSSVGLQVSSQPSNRDDEIRQALDDLRSCCRCDDRTEKPLRHWEYHCPSNPNKQPPLRCDLPGCKNRAGFLNKSNLERHQKTASYHKGKE